MIIHFVSEVRLHKNRYLIKNRHSIKQWSVLNKKIKI